MKASSILVNKFKYFEVIVLIIILVFAFFMAFIPHLNYPYPVHWDEWRNISFTNSIMNSNSSSFLEPFYGQYEYNLITLPEGNFFIFLGILHEVTGISFIFLYRLFPGLIFMCTVLSVYILCRSKGFGLEAAFLTCLIPSSTGILGPSFLVALSTGLMFTPIYMWLVYKAGNWQSYILLILFTFFLFFIHPPSATACIIIVIPGIILNIRNQWKSGLLQLMSVIAPALLILFVVFGLHMPSLEQLLSPQDISSYVNLPPLLQTYGYIPLILVFVGIVSLVARGGKDNLSVVFGFLLLLIALLVFVISGYGLSIFYERSLTIVLLLMSILGGAGLKWIRTTSIKTFSSSNVKSMLLTNTGNCLSAAIIIAILASSIPAHLKTDYYHIINTEDFRAFNWIKNNLVKKPGSALLDPWKANAFVALTDIYVVRNIYLSTEPEDLQIYKFLSDGCRDNTLIKDNDVSIIYNENECHNTDLIKINNNVYIVNAGKSSVYYNGNLLLNAGFENLRDNAPFPWNKWSRNAQANFLFPSAGHESAQSIGLEITDFLSNEEPPTALWFQDVKVESGKSYIIGGWIKTDGISGNGGVMIMPQWRDDDDNYKGETIIMDYISGDTDWIYYESSIKIPEDISRIRLSLLINNAKGKAWFDNVIVKEASNH